MRWGRFAAVVLGVVAVTGAGIAGVQMHRTARVAALATELEAESRPLGPECRWERAPLAGSGRDCNAAVEEHAAVVRLFADAGHDMIPGANLLDALDQDRAPPANVAAFIASHGVELSALHQATLCSWGCVRDVPYQSVHKGTEPNAIEVLLVSAVASPPPTCFSEALDALRIELDGETGLQSAHAYESPFQGRRMHATRRVLLACAARADAATLRSAANDAVAIAARPPPVGDAVGAEALLWAVSYLDDVLGKRWPDVPWVQRGAFLDAAQDLADQIPGLRTYRDEELPELFERLSREAFPRREAIFGDRRNEWSGDTTPNEILDVRTWLEDSLLRHAHLDRDLRLIAAALAAMRDRAATGAFPAAGPSELAAPSLRDPITGEAFVWTLGPTEGRATLLAPSGRGEDAEAVALP